MAKIIVTGGAGFIGSHLTDALIEQGHQVLVIDNLSTGKREYLNPQAKFFELDLLDFEKIKPIFQGADFVFHEAALPRVPFSVQNPKKTHEINVDGTLNVLIASRDAQVKKVVYASSSSVYGNPASLPCKETLPASPVSPYALQKHIGELYCKVFYEIYGLPTVSLRYFNVFGPRQPEEGAYTPVIGLFIAQKAKGLPLTITEDGEQTRDWTYVSDVVRANILAMESARTGRGEVINIGRGENHTVNKVAELIGGKTVYIPPRPGDVRHTLADISLAQELLGWRPEVSLEQGIKTLLENAPK